jgi:hypothetical protein
MIRKIDKKTGRIELDRVLIESSFEVVDALLLDKSRIRNLVYTDRDTIVAFDSGNSSLLAEITRQSIVYCIWFGETIENLVPKYVGHVSSKISKQRMIAHFSRKNKATGSQLEKVKIAVESDHFLGLTFVVIEPDYMRKAIEDWLIDKYSEQLVWNKQGRKKIG